MAPPKKNSRKSAATQDFLSAASPSFAMSPVELPEIGRTVYVRPLSAHARDAISAACRDPDKPATDESAYDQERFAVLLFGAMVVDADGNRLIPEGREDEIASLRSSVVDKLNTVIAQVANAGSDAGNG